LKRRGSPSLAPTLLERRIGESIEALPGETDLGGGIMDLRERQAASDHRAKAARNERRNGLALMCECADRRCSATLRLTPAEREHRHERPARFWVKPGHVLSFERVIEEDEEYAIIEGGATL
jgi:hypothetical protein